MNRLFRFVCMLFPLLLFNSCIVWETQEVIFTLKDNGSVDVHVKMYNLMSEGITADPATGKESAPEHQAEAVQADFEEFMEWIEKEMQAGIKNDRGDRLVSSRLFEENNQLCAEFVLNMVNPEDVGIAVDRQLGVAVLNMEDDNITEMLHTNGTFNGKVPLIVWALSESSFSYKALSYRKKEPDAAVSLLSLWKEYAKR